MSCLFDSLAHFINLPSFDIRQKICDYLESNGILIEGIDTVDILMLEDQNYIPNMRMHHTMGGAIELQAACNIWNTQILVINTRDKNIPKNSIEFYPTKSNPIISNPDISNDVITNPVMSDLSSGGEIFPIKIRWSGGHYEPNVSVKN